jgi:hypothetical protein
MKLMNSKFHSLIVSAVCLSMAACQSNNKPKTELGVNPGVTIEIFDEAASKLVSKNASIEVISTGYIWSEGPVWIPSQQFSCFQMYPKTSTINGSQVQAQKSFSIPQDIPAQRPEVREPKMDLMD